MAQLIERLQTQLNKEGFKARSDKSREWLLGKVKNLRSTRRDLMSDYKRLSNSYKIGKMYFYYYDPKTKEKLPYYDRFPLVIPSRMYEATPCIKRYLYSHIESRFLQIEASEWDIAATLPVEQFVKSRKTKVWSDSRKKY